MALTPGTRIGAYEVLALVGSGGMGEVYRARDARLGRDVAIKILPQAFLNSPDQVSRFEREARILAALNHPHVATIHGVEDTGGSLALVMELVDGPTLAELIASGPIPIKQALTLAQQIAGGLEAAHDKGIIHRDLKPANIKVASDGSVKVLDFGLAKFSDEASPADSSTITLDATQPGVILGTVAYMSPEQARGHATDKRTDVWAFGCVLYELLTSRRAFGRDTATDTIAAIIERDPDWQALPSAVPDRVRRVLERCLEKDVAARLRDLGDARLEFADAIDELRSSSPARSLSSSARRLAGHRRVWRSAAASAVAIAIAGVVVFQLLGTRSAGAVAIGAGGRPAVAVTVFENPERSQEIDWMTTALPTMLSTALGQIPGLDVISRERLREVANDLGLSAQPIDAGRTLEVARRSGAGAVVAGSVFKVGADLRIDLQVQNVGTGRLLGAHSVRSNDGVFRIVDELAARIQSTLNVQGTESGRSISDITSPSIEAYRLYNEGLDAKQNLRRVEARQLFLRAIEQDPTFASAYFQLVEQNRLLGDMAAANENATKVRAHLNRLPERQRLQFEAIARREANEPEAAARLFEQLIAKYPDEEDAYSGLQEVLNTQLRDPEGALAVMQRGAKALPYSGTLHNDLGYALIRAGRYDDAVRAFEAYARLKPREANPYDSLGETFLIAGQPDLAIEKYGRALEMDPTFVSSHEGRAWSLAMLGRFPEALGEYEQAVAKLVKVNAPEARGHLAVAFLLSRIGRYQDAGASIGRGLVAADRVKNPDAITSLLCLSVLMAIEQGKQADALAHGDRLHHAIEAIAPSLRVSWRTIAALLLGTAEARSGHLDAARRRLGEVSKVADRQSPHQNWWHYALAGEIALAAGDLAAASQAHSAGEPKQKVGFRMTVVPMSIFANNLFRDGAARVKAAQGDMAGAAAIYRQLLRAEKGQRWTSVLEPRFVLELARVLERQGSAADAREEYRRFLELWGEADAGLPELADARRGAR